jgi:hypothetical protein
MKRVIPFVQVNIWPFLPTSSSLPSNAFLVEAFGNLGTNIVKVEILKYTPRTSEPNAELATPGNIESARRLTGKIRIDVLPAPSLLTPNGDYAVIVGLRKDQWDDQANTWATKDPTDPAQACDPEWLFLQSRVVYLSASAGSAGFRDPHSVFTVGVNTTVGPGENLRLYMANILPTGDPSIVMVPTARLRIQELD